MSDDEKQYFFFKSSIIDGDKEKRTMVGKRLRFYPEQHEDSKVAIQIEVL